MLTSILVEPQVVKYLNKTWKYGSENYDSDNESDEEEDKDRKLIGGYSDDELEAIILFK